MVKERTVSKEYYESKDTQRILLRVDEKKEKIAIFVQSPGIRKKTKPNLNESPKIAREKDISHFLDTQSTETQM